MSLLKQQYTLDENDVHDFDAVREKFTEHDKSGTGIVTRQQVTGFRWIDHIYYKV